MSPENSKEYYSFGGAVVAFHCDIGFELHGDPLMYCDGTRWNSTEPVCECKTKPTQERLKNYCFPDRIHSNSLIFQQLWKNRKKYMSSQRSPRL